MKKDGAQSFFKRYMSDDQSLPPPSLPPSSLPLSLGILEQQRALKVLGARPTDVWIPSDPLLISVPSIG